jgi:hypothetical protein
VPGADSCTAENRVSLNYLTGNGEQPRRKGKAECSGCAEVDHQLELGRPQDRQVNRLLAFEDFSSIDTSLAISLADTCPLPAISCFYMFPPAGVMRFWIGLLLGLLIGAGATAGYYEFWNPGVEEPMEESDIGDK